MAIIKKVDGMSTASSFSTWLNSVKAGTFLENTTITSANATHPSDTYTTIQLGDDRFIIHCLQTRSWSSNEFDYNNIVSINSKGLVSVSFYQGNINNFAFYPQTCFLCKNGLIIRLLSGIGIGTTLASTVYWAILLLTIDSNGRLAVISSKNKPQFGYADSGSFHNYEIGGYVSVIGPSSSFTFTSTIDTNAYSTILQNFTAYDQSGQGYYTPFAYYAAASQFTPNNCTQLGVIELNSDKYITNGRWYVKDTD